MLILNKNYKFFNDVERILMINEQKFGVQDFKSYVHPVYAWMLNLFDGRTSTDVAIGIIAGQLGITQDEALSVLKPLMGNRERRLIRYDGVVSGFPKGVLVKAEGRVRERLPMEFFTSVKTVNHQQQRLFKPMNLLICPTLKCYTDCVYCYADRKHQHIEMEADMWADIIRQARQNGVSQVDVTGGEFFLKKGWQTIARALTENGYFPDISTKVPLDERTLDDIRACGLQTVQYSSDTLDSRLAISTLKVNDSYVQRIVSSIRYADSIGLRVILKPTLSRETCTIENVKEVIGLADSLTNVERVVVTVIGPSCYKPRGNYRQIVPDKRQMEDLRAFITECNETKPYPVLDDTTVIEADEMRNPGKFADRSICSGNMDGFFILPDGKATICEELYWHPQFLIGDVHSMSLSDIWNSPQALKLSHLAAADFPVDSACSQCKVVAECRNTTGVCWKMVIAAYGNDNPLYPDPRCPEAPVSDLSFVVG